MYEKAFWPLLAKKELSNAYLLYGSCELGLWVLADAIQKFYAADAVLRMNEIDYDFQKAIEFLQTNDLFYPKKLLKIELYKDELKGFRLKQLKDAASEDARLLVIAHTAKVQKASEKDFGSDFVRVFTCDSAQQALALLSDVARAMNIKAARADLQKLAQHYASNLTLAGEQLRKFAGEELRLDMCDLQDIQEEEFDRLFQALFEQELQLESFAEQIMAGEEVALLNRLTSSFLRLFKLIAYAKTHGSIDFSVALGYNPPPDVRKQLQSQAFKCGDKIEEILKTIIMYQDAIVSAKHDANSVLLSLICRVYSIIN